MSGDTKRVLEVNQIDNLQGSTQRVKQETTLNNLRGITQRVYVVGGGGTPVIDELNVTPSTSAQTITAPTGVDGYSPVNVSAVTSAIDANITAENIKKDVEILGVTGSYKGQTPTGTMYIISNGTYNVADKAIANVQVPTTAPAHYIEKTVDANGKLVNSGASIINLTGVTNLGESVLSSAYKNAVFSSNTSIDFSSLTSITGDTALFHAFYGATGITSVDMSNITTISGSSACSDTFRNSSITSLDLSSLTTISGTSACANMCNNCASLATVKLDSLTTISGSTSVGNWFYGCTALTSIKLNALTTLSVVMGTSYTPPFGGCTHLESIEFGGLKSTTFSNIVTQLRYLFNSSTGAYAPNGCTVHFPSNFDPNNPNKTFDITTLTGYPTFNGNASYIHLAYDLPATES